MSVSVGMSRRLVVLAALFVGAIVADVQVVRVSTEASAADPAALPSPTSSLACGASCARAPHDAPALAAASAPAAQAAQTAPVASRQDALATYLAMRDDGAPASRLRFVEEQARGAPSAATTDLLGAAMVDPDETVRARAQALYDQALSQRGTPL